MLRFPLYRSLGLAALLAAALLIGPGSAAWAQDAVEERPLSTADRPMAANLAVAAAAPTALPQTSVLPVLDNPAQPGDAFPNDPWSNTE